MSPPFDAPATFQEKCFQQLIRMLGTLIEEVRLLRGEVSSLRGDLKVEQQTPSTPAAEPVAEETRPSSPPAPAFAPPVRNAPVRKWAKSK